MVYDKAVSKSTICLLALLASLLATGCKDAASKATEHLQEKKLAFTHEDLLQAIASRDVASVDAFIAAGIAVNGKTGTGGTALCQACETGDLTIARNLLTAGADPNLARGDGQLPLVLASKLSDGSLVELLLEKGAEQDGKNAQNRTAMAEAILSQNLTTLKPLADKAPNRSLDYGLQLAALLGNVALLDLLLVQGADANSRSSEFQTPLMYAASRGHSPAVKILLERGAQRLALNHLNQTAADLAHANGHSDLADQLNEPKPTEANDRLPAEMPPTLQAAQFPALVDSSKQNAQAGTNPAYFLKLSGYFPETLPYMLVEVRKDEKTALIEDLRKRNELLEVEAGVTLPGTDLEVQVLAHRIRPSKSLGGGNMDVSTITLRNTLTNARVLSQMGVPIRTALQQASVLHPASGQNYTAALGNLFQVGQRRWRVVDIRPTQILVEDTASRETAVIER